MKRKRRKIDVAAAVAIVIADAWQRGREMK
jgi:hypothetical protein